MLKHVALSLALALALTTGACAGVTKTLLVSEASLATANNTFADAATEISRRCNAVPQVAPVNPAFCSSFKTFEHKWKQAAPLATQLWKVARNTSDVSIQKNTEATLNTLAGELAGFVAQLGATYLTPATGGK